MERRDLSTVLNRNIALVLPHVDISHLDENASLRRDYGADSLQVVEIISRTLNETHLKVKRAELSRAKTISDVLDVLEAALPPAHVIA